MIGGGEVYKVVTAVLPLYTAIFLGYASIKWWQMFKPDHCDAINRFNCYFVMPFFTFQFVSKVNPYEMNFRFLAADMIAKAMIGVALLVWTNFGRNGSFSWSITTFSLSSLNNTLLIGVPLLQAMYGDQGSDLVIQSSVIQSLLWCICLLFMLELRRAKLVMSEPNSVRPIRTGSERVETAVTIEPGGEDGGAVAVGGRAGGSHSLTLGKIMKMVGVKLAKNPNSYACIVGLIWALIAKRWHIRMPKIIEGQILIMSRGGAGLAMFTMGLFMALQEKVIACGVAVGLYALALRFVIGPAATAIGAFITGLHGHVFHIAIVQSALPQSLAAFIYHQEYGLHSQVLSTAVIFGTVISLPLLIGYYAVLDILN